MALIGLGLLVGTAMVGGGWWFHLHSVRSRLDERFAAAESQTIRLKETVRLIETTQARRTQLVEQLGDIERLTASKRASANLLESLSRSLPDDLWLLEVKQTGDTIQVDGRALSIAAITSFTERVESSGMFPRPVEILTISTEALEDTTVVRFAVKADVATPPAAR